MTSPLAGSGGRGRRARPAGLPAAGVLVILAATAGCAGPPADITWSATQARIEEAFPGVPAIDTAALADAMQDPSRRLVLIDVREPEEFAVSHLEGAVRAESVGHAAALARNAPDGALVVAYCSVGYRSAALVAVLRDRGLTGVHNLTGSIFRWANEDRPLWRGDVPATRVHPFDASWGVLLQPERRAGSSGAASDFVPEAAGPGSPQAASSRATGGR